MGNQFDVVVVVVLLLETGSETKTVDGIMEMVRVG
jgi:hypothetical protein